MPVGFVLQDCPSWNQSDFAHFHTVIQQRTVLHDGSGRHPAASADVDTAEGLNPEGNQLGVEHSINRGIVSDGDEVKVIECARSDAHVLADLATEQAMDDAKKLGAIQPR